MPSFVTGMGGIYGNFLGVANNSRQVFVGRLTSMLSLRCNTCEREPLCQRTCLQTSFLVLTNSKIFMAAAKILRKNCFYNLTVCDPAQAIKMLARFSIRFGCLSVFHFQSTVYYVWSCFFLQCLAWALTTDPATNAVDESGWNLCITAANLTRFVGFLHLKIKEIDMQFIRL